MACPDCGSDATTTDLGNPDRQISPFTSVGRAVDRLEPGDRLEVDTVCWACGYTETRTLELTSVDETHGDPAAALEDRITELEDELATTRDRLGQTRDEG